MKILALDFDGVISDSAPECFVTALRAYTQMRESAHLTSQLAACVDEHGGVQLERVQANSLYRDFTELMPLGNRAEDFGVELAALDAGASLLDQSDFDAYFASQGPDFAREFHERFYRERHRFSAAKPEEWTGLARGYTPLLEVLRRREGAVDLAIATAKDRESVDRLLTAYRVRDLFDDELIFDKEMGRDKREHLEGIRERRSARFDEITFVDDKVNHLVNVEGLGVRCVLAEWGYNGAREREEARSRGFTVCPLDRVEEMLID